ncbi:AsmA family protein [Coraliomargarita sp. SDUM461004]|uniref:AsmA family protein n=1 Tax=Thalassobacterium sedimentorum TaxID=3041258 RepID=A0ABU1AIZ8_9BACT|nr:AsmA family protein [Coraliomargarita sp. SDUM461004]MDQ8194614.1 AsmA family protein [Coraliomargarita sp. SDUM461004]
MKTLIRIFLIFIGLLVIVAGAGYFIVMRPSFQKKLVESQLPVGSSIQFVKVTPSRIELSELKLQLADGTTAKVKHLRSDFSPMAALFHDTIELRGLQVDGLVVQLPAAMAAPTSSRSESSVGTGAPAPMDGTREAIEHKEEVTSSPTDALYALGDLGILFDIDSVQLNGALIDAVRNRYTFDIGSDRMAPGAQTTVEAALKLESQEGLQGGLKEFTSQARLIFTQKQAGGFEQLHVESQTEGSDANGGSLVSISQSLDLMINGFEESGSFTASFNADLPHPEVFAPELLALQGLSLQGALKASAEGSALILETADFEALSRGEQVASVKLKQRLTLGAEQEIVGELMQINLINLPLAWLNPWLGRGLQLSGDPLSAQVTVSGESSGALQVKTLAPLQIGPLALYQNDQVLLQEISLRMTPVARVEADQSIHFDVGDLQLLDRYGVVLSGQVSASQGEGTGASQLAGMQAEVNLDLGLAELLRQPVFAGVGNLMAGQAHVLLDVDGTADYPAQIQVGITGLRARELPGSRQDYRFAVQLKETASGSYAVGSNFQAGSEQRPSTSLQLAGQVQPEQQPMPFKIQLTGPLVSQSDIDLLLAALQSPPATNSAVIDDPMPQDSAKSPADTSSVASSSGHPEPPLWADYNGEISVQIDELSLQSGHTIRDLRVKAEVSEALLRLSELAAAMQEGQLSGEGQVTYDANLDKAYAMRTSLSFKNVDPSMFSKQASGSFPVRGLFDGNFNVSGRGASLQQTIEDSEADLLVTGREGVLTAFELDDRSQLGLLGVGILGQSLKRPGITAMAQAVPYFKDMKFENFTLKLVRAQDKKVNIPELKFIGDNLRINGQGVIAASSLNEVLNQPLDLTLGLAAKGRLIEYLDTLQLLGPKIDEDGFRNWNKDIVIGGTLGAPNTSSLKDLLNNAARSAFSSSNSDQESTPATSSSGKGEAAIPPADGSAENLNAVPNEKKKSKEEKRRDDIEMGLDLLNSMFGSP